MIDFHTHLLPGIDDGSRDILMTEEMLKIEATHGVDRIVATPHFYAERSSIDAFLSARADAHRKVEVLLEERPELPRVMTAAEVAYFRGMGRAEKIGELTLTGSNVILVEMPFVQWTEEMYQDLVDLIERKHMRVVLAHVERYIAFQKRKKIWKAVLDLPVIVQLNGGSFLKDKKKRKFCLKLIKKRGQVIIGSDCHNLTSRVPNLDQARTVIEDELGQSALDEIDALMYELTEV